MKRTFSQFLKENGPTNIKDLMIRPEIKDVDKAQLVKLLDTEYSHAWRAFKDGSALYRGDSMLNTLVMPHDIEDENFELPVAKEADSSKSHRFSKASNNLYQLAMDNLPQFKDAASRTRSFICSTNIDVAAAYSVHHCLILPHNTEAKITGSKLDDFLMSVLKSGKGSYDFDSVGKLSLRLVKSFEYFDLPKVGQSVTDWEAYRKAFNKVPQEAIRFCLLTRNPVYLPNEIYDFTRDSKLAPEEMKDLCFALLDNELVAQRLDDCTLTSEDLNDLDPSTVSVILNLRPSQRIGAFKDADWKVPILQKFASYLESKHPKVVKWIDDSGPHLTLEGLISTALDLSDENFITFKADSTYESKLSGLKECWVEGKILAIPANILDIVKKEY